MQGRTSIDDILFDVAGDAGDVEDIGGDDNDYIDDEIIEDIVEEEVVEPV